MSVIKGCRKMTALLALAVLAGLFATGGLKLISLPEGGEAEDESGEIPLAADWFLEQRAYPLRTIPEGARTRAIEQADRESLRLRQRRVMNAAEASDAAAFGPQWEALGPQPITNGNTGPVSRPVSGRVSAIALDPNYNGTTNQTIYIGAAQGGVWRSRDNGATWTPLTDNQASLAIGSIAIDPFNSNVIYVGTGEGNGSADSYYGAGLLKSIDGGATWTQITGPNSTTSPQQPAFLNSCMVRIAIDRNNTSTLFAATRAGATHGASGGAGSAAVPLGQRGIWKSADGGASWKNADPSGTGGANSGTDVLIDPKNSSRIYAALLSQGIYRSVAGGEPGTWEKLITPTSTGLPESGFSRIALAAGPPLAPSTNATIYAAYADSSGASLLGIYRSTDNGATWTKLTSPPNVQQTFYNLALAVDPQDANIIYFGEIQFYRSTDGGSTWNNQLSGNGNGNGGLHVDQHAIVINPNNRNQLFVGNDGGIFRSDNATDTTIGWFNLNQTLNTVQFQAIALHPTDSNYLLGGTQDNGTNRFTGSTAWTRVQGGDGGFTLVDQANPSIVYHTFFNQSGSSASFGPEVSFSGGAPGTWIDRRCLRCSATPGNMNPNDRVGFYSPMALNPGFTQQPGSNVIYFGTHRLYRSSDNGATWTGLGPGQDGFGADLSKGSGRLSAITAYPKLDTSTNPPGETVWVGTSDGNVQVTVNAGALAGATFTNVTKAPLPNRFVTDIATDASDPKKAWVVYSGFDANTPGTPGHVFVTTDQGATWTNISGNLPDIPVTSIAPDPFLSNTLYIGTDIGVFQTTDGGATWARLDNGMPKVATYMVRYHTATRSLIAATHGRGIYRLSLARAVTSVSAANYSRTSLAVEGIAAAFGTGLATATQAATTVPLPTTLAGTTVKVRDITGTERLAPLFFVSPAQVNYQIPQNTQPGAVAITITSSDGTISTGSETVSAVAPSLFTANSSGSGAPAAYAVRVRSGVQTIVPVIRFDNTLIPPQFVAEPIDLGPTGDTVVLVLFGTGIRKRSALSAVSVMIGNTSQPPDFAGDAPGFVGLDQINVVVPRSLIGAGQVNVAMTVDGAATNTVSIRIK
ncbi:MAG TPA: hypothetical protein VNQ79_28685 [Blastocatellia bacterium]|nr:hypothetical protein [Blastocatellia bacterium]